MDMSSSSHHRGPPSPRGSRHRVSIPSSPGAANNRSNTALSRASSTGSGMGVTSAQAAAASSLQLLLREDRLLQEFGLTESKPNPDQVAFPYAAALLQDDNDEADGGDKSDTKRRADVALQDVERKLALVESLAVKLSRTRPEAVAGHLLRLHGYEISETCGDGESLIISSSATSTAITKTNTTLASIRDRADRLERQSDVLDGVANRVESSLARGLTRMESACTRLERVLTLSSTLKSIMRLQFESNKLFTYDLEDPRDLTRAAASVAILEDLLAKPELQEGIIVVDKMRPSIHSTAKNVRKAAAILLQEQYSQPTALSHLGTTLQVYFHLGELPEAVWQAVSSAHEKAEAVSRQLFNALTLVNLTEQAKKTAKEARLIQKKLKQLRAEAAHEWAQGMTQVTLNVRNLQRVLSRKSDPVTRQVFGDVVASAPTPAAYARFGEASIFSLFWARMCFSLSDIIQTILLQDQGKYIGDVAALYPAVRSAAMELIGRLQETLPVSAFDDATAAPNSGILGGSSVLNDSFTGWSFVGLYEQDPRSTNENPQAAADSWTRISETESAVQQASKGMLAGHGNISLSAIFQSAEWKALQSNGNNNSGLYPLQQAFVRACTDRLNAPLQYMFPDHVQLDEDGMPVPSGLPLLPSKYDVQRFDENIRQELSLADPREGGGDVTLVTMIAECVVNMISNFCDRAKNALSGVSEDNYLKQDWSMTESLQHDRKVITMLYTLAKYLREAPDKTFVAPYRPASSAQHEEASKVCQAALVPALQDIDKMARQVVLNPLCRAINRRISKVIAKIHDGVYIQSATSGMADDGPSFVQKHVSNVLEVIAEYILSRFPPDYACIISSKIANFCIYTYISNASLIRPLGESTRLHITQDLADLEMALEQMLLKNGGTQSLSQIDNGKPYAELRSTRQMLFWAGLEIKDRAAQDIIKALVREVWMKDMRASTVFHYLFSFAPSLLSSPHHVKRMRAEEYVAKLVQWDGSIEEGEDFAWMTAMASCDAYQQRASSVRGETMDGDVRVPQILMQLGHELMRRRRN